MLDWIEIRHFAVAARVELDFDGKFTVVTGETGSGKSIIVDAIGILLGHRSDASYIMHDQDSAEIQAGFDLSPGHPALSWLEQQGLDNEGECILRRVLRRDKTNRGYINGRAATVTQLRDLGRELVDIHGQNEHHSLLKRSVQLGLLDHAAGNQGDIQLLAGIYEKIRDIREQIRKLDEQSQATQERIDLLRFQLDELEELDPKPDEWEELGSRQKRLAHLQELTQGTQDIAHTLLESESDSIDSRLIECAQQLKHLSQFDDGLGESAGMVEEARIILEEVARQLLPHYRDNQMESGEAARIEDRFSRYHSLSRKHRVDPGQLSEHLDFMRNELDTLKDPAAELARLHQQLDQEVAGYEKIAGKIRKKREKHGQRFSREVTELMQRLGMNGGEFRIELMPTENDRVSRFGTESVEFLVMANPGQPLQPLSKVVSGGELSRISLAIQVILANKAQVPTLIFDEVDVGIGGEIANVVGARLKELGKSRQVLCITHLSQVAARGDHHIVVTKKTGKKPRVNVATLDGDRRIEEIARMTAGEKITKQSLAHAQEMLKSD